MNLNDSAGSVVEPIARLARLRPDSLTPEQRALYNAMADGRRGLVIRQDGTLPGPFNAMLYNPSIGLPLQGLGLALRFAGRLSNRVREFVTLTVAALEGCEYEWRSHEPLARLAGADEAELRALRSAEFHKLHGELEQTAVKLCITLLRTGDLDDDAYAQGVGRLGEAGLVELTTLVGYYRLLALQLRVFRAGLINSNHAPTQ